MNNKHKKTAEILKWFEEISKIPRCSQHEKQIGLWLMNWGNTHGFTAKKDDAGNIMIRIPGSPGYENSEPVIIQGHLDMVCEKTPDSPHDFDTDPIHPVYDGEWLKADNTTLGADNGIAIAMGLAAALDTEIHHPPLELLFTVDEETALTGAFALQPGFVSGKRLLNIDSEEEGVLTIGCAGGEKSEHAFPLDFDTPPQGFVGLTINASNMSGGHSADIHHEKANALKVMGRALHTLRFLENIDLRLAYVKGGTVDNAIPRESTAVIFVHPHSLKKIKETVSQVEKILKIEFKNTDPDLSLAISEEIKEIIPETVSLTCTEKVIQLILALPHGIYAMSTEVEHFVETSNNFASCKIEDRQFRMVTSQRSPLVSRLDDVGRHIAAVVKLAGGSTVNRGRYPGWFPNNQSPLLQQCITVYEKMFGQKPRVETTHGGLECGVIGSKFPGMDMISFGPTIKHPHSPEEMIHIPAIGKVWDFMTALLEVM